MGATEDKDEEVRRIDPWRTLDQMQDPNRKGKIRKLKLMRVYDAPRTSWLLFSAPTRGGL